MMKFQKEETHGVGSFPENQFLGSFNREGCDLIALLPTLCSIKPERAIAPHEFGNHLRGPSVYGLDRRRTKAARFQIAGQVFIPTEASENEK
jgi:hypothetical protein